MGADSCALAFSGGTDSTCAAALLAERFAHVHLLTFRELGTGGAPVPTGNVEKLRVKFPNTEFIHRVIPVDRLVEKIGYDRYPSCVARHGLFMLSTCGFSSLSWHARMIVYCLDNGLAHAADGLTRELMHFPGHMDGFVEGLRGLYGAFGVVYENPVRDWEVPPDQRFLDRLIVDPHGFPLIPGGPERPVKTTGRHLFDIGLMPSPNVKGSELDRSMQHDCYPFMLFHLFAFWYALPLYGAAGYERRVTALFQEKISDMRALLEDYRARGGASALAGLVEA
ncbi:MAG: hypothetical protein ABL955_02170 [Elusimicrobiota bacterium]